MANNDIANHMGFVAKNKVSLAGDANSGVATPANYASVASMRTRLAAINGSYYTTAMLDAMTENDMVYALRTLDDSGTI
jgi:hypothetical protein